MSMAAGPIYLGLLPVVVALTGKQEKETVAIVSTALIVVLAFFAVGYVWITVVMFTCAMVGEGILEPRKRMLVYKNET